jgi:hypothetical protein
MADYGYSDYEAELSGVNRRRKLAEALTAQSMQSGKGIQAGRFYVPPSPLEPLVRGLNAFAGAKAGQQADTEAAAAGSKRSQALAAALSGMPRAGLQAQPTDQEGTGSFDMAGTQTPQRVVQPTMADNAGWVARLSRVGPDAVQMGTNLLGMQQKSDENSMNRDARLQERIMTLDAAAQNAALSREERAARAAESATLRREMMESQQAFAGQQADANRALRTELAQQASADRQAAAANKPLTEFQGNAVLFGSRAAAADRTLKALEEKINVPGLAVKRSLENVPVIGGLLGAAGNTMLTQEQQQVEQAQRDFVNAVLRKESGAVINPGEFANAIKQYFPAPGDDAKVKEQKRQNRAIAIAGLRTMAGPGGSSIDQALANTPDLNAAPAAEPSPANAAPGLSPAEQQELDQLRKRFGRVR